MKIKQKQIFSPLKTPSKSILINSKVSNRSQQHSNVIHPYLPSKQILYHQLISQLGIRTQEQRIKFKNYFTQKYLKHLELLQGHNQMEKRFLLSKQSMDIDEQRKISQMKQYMNNKQVLVSARKQKNDQKIRKKVNIQQQRWKQVIQKNKNQYLKNIKNSMKLIKRWENKLVSSSDKRNQRLNQIVAHVQQHNQYVNSINIRSRIQQRQIAQENIARLENSLSLRAKTEKSGNRNRKISINPQENQLNPDSKLSIKIRNKTKQFYQKPKTQGSQIGNVPNANTQILNKHLLKYQRIKSPHHSQVSLSSCNTQRLIKQSSTKVLVKKSQIDQKQVQYLLCKNVQKQKKILEARNVKNYLHEQRIKQITKRQQQIRYKMMQNLNRLKEQQENRNNNLDIKFNQNRKKNKYISAIIPKKISYQSSSQQSYQQKYNKINVSLPSIKISQNKQMLPPIKQSFISGSKIQNKRSNSNKYKINTINRSSNGKIYLTDNSTIMQNDNYGSQLKNKNIRQKQRRKQRKKLKQTQDQSNLKYNRHIIDKLRSVSLIAHLKYKQNNQNVTKNRIQHTSSNNRQK